MAVTDKLRLASNGTQAVPTSLAAPMAFGATTATLNVATGWPTATGVDVVMYLVDTSGTKVAGSQTGWVFQLTGTTLSGGVLKSGTMPATGYPGTTATVVTVRPTAAWGNDLINALLGVMNQDGSLKTVPVQTALGLGTASLNGWNALGATPNTVVANGNRSYALTFNGTDQTGTLSAGMRLRTTRTVAAPTQCTSLNGTTQYWSKATPAGMTFTNNFVVTATAKQASYPTNAVIASRYDGTSGWQLQILADGRIQLVAYNGGSANSFNVTSTQTIPLNKWSTIAAQMDMTVTTNTPTTNYIMLDGVDIPAVCTRTGTSPTSLLQGSGSLQIGALNGTNFYPGKLAQVAIYSAKVTQATLLASTAQGLAGTETSLVSAYSFNNSANDLNTTNANNLTSNGSAVATSADSPFGCQADGTISSTLDYAIVQKVSFSTNTTVTVQVPEGCTIPTSGGVAAVVYSSNKAPYGMPTQRQKWAVLLILLATVAAASGTAGTISNPGGLNLNIPLGEWFVRSEMSIFSTTSTTSSDVSSALSTSATAVTDLQFSARTFLGETNNSNTHITQHSRTGSITTTAATPYYLLVSPRSTVSALAIRGATGDVLGEQTQVVAENAYL